MINGKKIRQIRNNIGYTTLDVHRLSLNYATPVSKSYLEEIERSEKTNPAFNVVETIADILCVEIDELRILKQKE